MNLTEWARVHGVPPQTAYRWFRQGRLPVAAVRVGPRTILVNPQAPAAARAGGAGVHARVSSHHRRGELERQVARLTEWAQGAGVPVEMEVGSGMGGARSTLRRLLADPKVTIVVKHHDRCGRSDVGVAGR